MLRNERPTSSASRRSSGFVFNEYGTCIEPETVFAWRRNKTTYIELTVAQHPVTGYWASGGEFSNGTKGGNMWPCGLGSKYDVGGPRRGYTTRTKAVAAMFIRYFAEAGDIMSPQILEVLRSWASGYDWRELRQ